MSASLKVSSHLFASAIVVALFASSCVTKKELQTVTVKTTATPTGTTATATATVGPTKKEGIKKFSDVIPPKTKVDKGLFNTYKVEGKYYYEIPDSLLNREM